MSQRAIDQFRPQPASTPQQVQPQGHPATSPSQDISLEETIDPPALSLPSLGENGHPASAQGGRDAQLETQPALEYPPSSLSNSLTAASAMGVAVQPYPSVAHRIKRRVAQSARFLGAPLIWLGVVAFCSGTGYAAFHWLLTIPPVPECDRLWFFSLDSDKLFCAEKAAQSGTAETLVAGLKLVDLWPSNHQLAPRATRLKREWSKQLLQLASAKALQNDLEAAIELAKVIQPGNPVYRDAKNAILEWEKLRDRDYVLTDVVESALKRHDWQKAEAELQPPSNQMSEYQRQQFNRLKERVVTERMAFNQLQQLRTLVQAQSSANSETLGRAIQLAAQINPRSYVSVEVARQVQQWSQALAKIAENKLNQGDIPGAIAAAQWLPTTLSLSPKLQELVWVSRAQQVANQQSQLFSYDRLWQHAAALAMLQPISADSPLYSAAQAHRLQLQNQVQDLTQLTLASTVAKVPQIPALQFAIQMAQAITPDRPNRIAAQTLIAEWRKDIQRVEDRPYLTLAQRVAKAGKVKDLQTAIAHASKIALGRALRPEAQAAIFDWRQQIQTIEDKPILDRARKLAEQKRLIDAIREADKIPVGRTLHPEAQAAILRWTKMIQTAEDQPILNEARVLANQGNVGAAIGVAYQIAPGRALYEAAQKEIAVWSAQLAAVRPSRRWNEEAWDNRSRNREPTPQSYDAPRRWQQDPAPALPPEPPPPPELPPP
ncbi:hypothetical protein OsccyDRAFT_1887 [Leptolyngbyaceae cyanobacterium JSC-12]|nr:hypothetical protein OsccyDRAFT_1887 [Leptolyngbyaceae cyanobacterium JSC-12]